MDQERKSPAAGNDGAERISQFQDKLFTLLDQGPALGADALELADAYALLAAGNLRASEGLSGLSGDTITLSLVSIAFAQISNARSQAILADAWKPNGGGQ